MSLGIWIFAGIAALLIATAALRSRDTTVSLPGPGEAPPSASQLAPTGASATKLDAEFEARLPRMMLRGRDTAFFGRWWEGERRSCRVAFQPAGKGLAIFAGEIDPDLEQLSEIYLSQASDTQPLPAEDSSRRPHRALPDGGAEIDERFFLNATGSELAELRSAAVRMALLGLSESVEEVMIFETGGVQLIAGPGADAATIAADLDRAIEIHAAVRALR